MKEIIIVGYSGHAFVAIDVLEQRGYSVKGYCDREEKLLNPYSLSYLGSETALFESKEIDLSTTGFFVGIGDNTIREKVYKFLVSKNAVVVNALHPGAIISRTSVLGEGVLIAANATINPLCTIGNGVICNTASVVDHECIIKDFAHICPSTVLCGNVTIGKNCFIGANSVVKQGVSICDNVVIGAGSTVVKDIRVPGTYFGNKLRLVH